MQPAVVSAGYDLYVVVSSITSDPLRQRFTRMPVTNSQVNRIVISNDNKIAVATNPYVIFFDPMIQNAKPAQYTGHMTNVTDIVINDKVFYTCSEDRTWQVWDRNQPSIKSQRKCQTSSALNAIALHPNGSNIITANEKGQIELWDINSSGASSKPIATHRLSSIPVRSIALSNDGTKMVAACQDGYTFVLEVDSVGFTEKNKIQAHSDAQLRCCISPNEKYFVTTSADSTAKLWDFEKFECIHTLTEVDQKKWIWDAAFTPDSSLLVTAGTDKNYRTWDVKTGKCIYKNDSAHTKGITSLAILNV